MDEKQMNAELGMNNTVSETENGVSAEQAQTEAHLTPADNGENNELMKKLMSAEALAAENHDKYQRALAEFDNFRKRTAKEKTSIYNDGAADIIKALLPVFDSFERALGATSEADRDAPVYAGLNLIYKQLRKFMEDNEITEIEALGKTFDPVVHQAIAHMESPDFGVNEVAEELQKGYKLKDKVIRHSVVRVAN